MTCHSDHRNLTQAGLFGDIETQLTYGFSWLYPVGYLVFSEANSLHK